MTMIDGRQVIPASDLPERPVGRHDALVGVVRTGQTLATFPVSELPTPNAAQAEIDALKAGQQTSAIYAGSLANLQAMVGAYDGQGGFVTNGVGVGQYAWSSAASAWQFLSADLLTQKADKTVVADAVGGLQRLGNAAPAAGTGSSANPNFILSSIPARAGFLSRLLINARSDGTVNVGVYRAVNGPPAVPGSLLSRVATVPVAVSAGANAIDLREQNVVIVAGDLIGVAGNGVLSYTTVTAGGPRYYSVSGPNPTLGGLANDNRWEFGIDVEFSYSKHTPIGAGLADVTAEVRSPVDGLATKPGRDEISKTLGSNLQRIANSAPQVGTPYGSGATIVCTTPVEVADKISRLKIGSAIASAGSLVVYRPPEGVAPGPGVTVTRILVHPIQLVAGVNILTGDALPDLALQPGDLIGISANSALTYTTGSAGGPRYYQLSGASATLSNPINDNRWEWGVEIGFEFSESAPLWRSVIDYVDEKTGGSRAWMPTKSFIEIWLNGQSLGAGRALGSSQFAIEEGRSYKWDPINGIVHLVDPTGTDTTAQTGRASIGPALAQAVLEATNGRVGVILVNTAIGSTTVSNWRAGGSSWAAALPKWDAAQADILAKKLNVIGVVGLVLLGESDANSGTSANTYKSGILELRDNMRSKVGVPKMPFIIAQLGINTDDPSSASWAALRKAQSELARNGDIIIAHRRARHFVDDGWMQDNLHPNELANDEMGGAIGEAVAAFGIGAAPIEFD